MIQSLMPILRWLVIIVAVAALAVLFARRCGRPTPALSPVAERPLPEPSLTPPAAGCAGGGYEAAARDNAFSLSTRAWSPFGRAEQGWAIYAPMIGHTLGTGCGPSSAAFASALASWQGAHRLPASGRLDEATFIALKRAWVARRPYVRLRGEGTCPDPPPPSQLATATPAESYGGKTIQLRAEALDAYRQMTAAARAEVPGLSADPRWLTIFSGYRSPKHDAARCAGDGNCDGIVRANCSPHRTGLAADLYLGYAPGYSPDSSADPNRLHMSRTPAYRWLVANAGRFSFVNYPFEPWHWEWVGAIRPAPDAPRSSGPPPSASPPA